MFELSNEILGITFLAWGNSMGDLIVNPAIAKQGFAQMAIAACFGGPLLSILCSKFVKRPIMHVLLGAGKQCFLVCSPRENCQPMERRQI